jgi:hypothetical protein
MNISYEFNLRKDLGLRQRQCELSYKKYGLGRLWSSGIPASTHDGFFFGGVEA